MKILGVGVPELVIILVVFGVPALAVFFALVYSKRKQRKQSQEPPSPTTQEGARAIAQGQSPALDRWKTSVGFSILGAVVGFAAILLLAIILALVLVLLFVFLTGLVSSGLPGMGNFVSEVTQPIALIIAYTIRIVYALVFYPSYFTDKPVIKSNRVISFLNFSFGYVVFGALWNRSLTMKKKGVSYIVSAVLDVLLLLRMVVGMMLVVVLIVYRVL